MKILDFDEKSITFSNGTETFTFVNLAKSENITGLENKNNYWVLKRYSTFTPDGTEVTTVATFNPNATYNTIVMGHQDNEATRRTIKLDDEGYVTKDYITITGANSTRITKFHTNVEPQTTLANHLGKKVGNYQNGDYHILNYSFPDSALESFLQKNDEFSLYLNHFGSNEWKMKDILKNYEDVFHIRDYDYEMQKVIVLKYKSN